jgi:hypothetical protein
MKPHIVQTAIAVTVLACSSAPAPAPTASPAASSARGLRNLNEPQAEADLAAIAVEAAMSVQATSAGSRPFFGGVFVSSRKNRLASDAVVRATGFTAVNGTGPAKVECRAQNVSTGQTKPIPCPAQAVDALPPSFSFLEVRATADSAYVGVMESNPRASRASCITLARNGTAWKVLTTLVIADPRQCGK